MHRAHKVKRENQPDATNTMLIIQLSVSTCFGHHYAHHQENKTVSYCMRCSVCVCRLWLAVVLWSCIVGCVHTDRTPHAVRHGLILLMMGIIMPKTCWDRKFDNKHRIRSILFLLSLHLVRFVCVILHLLHVHISFQSELIHDNRNITCSSAEMFITLLIAQHIQGQHQV